MRTIFATHDRSRPEFFVFGVGGYVAHRHLAAIRIVGGTLVGACDTHDSVGILDSMALNARFVTNEESARAFLAGHLRTGHRFCVICTPTDRHLDHAGMALAQGWNVICEKPVVLDEIQYRALQAAEAAARNATVWPVLQMRFHPELQALRSRVNAISRLRRHQVELMYFTPRGSWYGQSWKADPSRSGGLALNIGIHLFDCLIWIFGQPISVQVAPAGSDQHLSGVLQLERADVSWVLSTRPSDHPEYRSAPVPEQLRPLRRMVVDGEPVDFSTASDMHVAAYRAILQGNGPRLSDALGSLTLSREVQRLAPRFSSGNDVR